MLREKLENAEYEKEEAQAERDQLKENMEEMEKEYLEQK